METVPEEETFTEDIEGVKSMLGGFEEMALGIFEECHDPSKKKMLANVRRAFAAMREEIGALSSEADLEAFYANAAAEQ